MKSSKYKKASRSSSSKLHKTIGEILITSELFKHYRIYQEYPVKDINPTFPNRRCKFDWVILDLKIVIEVMGKQHYTPTDFSGSNHDEAFLQFQRQQHRDRQKKWAVEEVGWGYVEINYKEVPDITEDILWQKIKDALNVVSEPLVLVETKKERARKWRKQQYSKLKDLKRRAISDGLPNQGHSEDNSQTQD